LAKDMDPDRFFQWLLEDEEEPRSGREVVLVKKVCTLGEPAVGKTSLIRRFVFDVFQLRMMIWDIAGHGALDFVKPSYYRDAEGALIVCDLTRKLTMNKIPAWIDSFFSVTQKVPLVLIGNKNDLVDQQEATPQDLAQLASQYRCPYITTSAKVGDYVEGAFRGMGLSLIQTFLKNRK